MYGYVWLCMAMYGYVCMSMYVCLCMYVCMHGCMYGWMDGWIHPWIDGWMYMDAYGCIWMYMDVHGCIWMYMDVYGCIWPAASRPKLSWQSSQITRPHHSRMTFSLPPITLAKRLAEPSLSPNLISTERGFSSWHRPARSIRNCTHNGRTILAKR